LTETRPQNDVLCVEWDVKLYSLTVILNRVQNCGFDIFDVFLLPVVFTFYYHTTHPSSCDTCVLCRNNRAPHQAIALECSLGTLADGHLIGDIKQDRGGEKLRCDALPGTQPKACLHYTAGQPLGQCTTIFSAHMCVCVCSIVRSDCDS